MLNKMDPTALGLDASLIEAAKKCNCMENDPYNATAAGPANLPSLPNGSLPDAMTGKISIADEKKKVKKENAMDAMKPGYVKTDRGYA
jgi:hypothetical protein